MGATLSGGGVNLMQMQRSMIFIDGTNLFYRLEGARLVVEQLSRVFNSFNNITGYRQVSRIYVYTIQEHLDRATKRHGPQFLEGIRVVLGHGIPTGDGNIKEKAVDALLVADLIYHAASRNYDHAVLVSADTDFVHAIRRVEDFGCRTAVVGFCSDIPDRLKAGSDQHFIISREQLIATKLAKEV
jgi:uncharacterized LabA/DUF88 family protein